MANYPEFKVLKAALSKNGSFKNVKKTQADIEKAGEASKVSKGTPIKNKFDYAQLGCMAIYNDIVITESLDLKGRGKLKKFLKAFKRGGVTERLKKLCLDTIIALKKAGNDVQKKQQILNSFMLKLHSIIKELSTQAKKASLANAESADDLASIHVSLLCLAWENLLLFYAELVRLNKNVPISPFKKVANTLKNFINGNKGSDSDNDAESDWSKDSDNDEESEENEESEDGEEESDENEDPDDEADSDDNKKSKKSKKPNSKKRKGFRIKGSKKSNKKKQNENSDDGELEEKYYSSDDKEENDEKNDQAPLGNANKGNQGSTPSEDGTSGDDFDNSEGNDEDPSEGSDENSDYFQDTPNVIQTPASQDVNYVQPQAKMNYPPDNGHPQQGDNSFSGYNRSVIQTSMGQTRMTSQPPLQQSNLPNSSEYVEKHQTSNYPAPNNQPTMYPADGFPQSQENARQFYPQNTIQSSVPVVPPTSAPQPKEYNLSTPNYSGQSYSKVEGSKYATMNQNGNRIAAANMRGPQPQEAYPPPPPMRPKQSTEPNLNNSQPVNKNISNTAFASSMSANRQQNYTRQESRNNMSQNYRATYTHGYSNPAPTATQFGAPQKTIYAPNRNANGIQPTSSIPQPSGNVDQRPAIHTYNIPRQNDRQFNAPQAPRYAPNTNANGAQSPQSTRQPSEHVAQRQNISAYNPQTQAGGQFNAPRKPEYAPNNNANGVYPTSNTLPPQQRPFSRNPHVTFADGQTPVENQQFMAQPRNNRIFNSPQLTNMTTAPEFSNRAPEPVPRQSPQNLDQARIQNNNFTHTAQTQNVNQQAPDNQAQNPNWQQESTSDTSDGKFVLHQSFTAGSDW